MQVLTHSHNDIITRLTELIYFNFGHGTLDVIVNEELTPQINVPALMFHDTADNVTPVEDSRAIAKAWSNAQLIETSGLGHRGALQSKEIHEQVIEFLKS